MRASLKLEGLEEAIKGMRGLGDASKFRIVRNAARAGASTVRRELKQAAPKGDKRSEASKKYGALKGNIKASQQGRLPYYTVHTNDAFWGAFLDTGTGKHNVRPGPRAKGAAAKTHMQGTQWFTRTVERMRGTVTGAMLNNIRQSLLREIARLK